MPIETGDRIPRFPFPLKLSPHLHLVEAEVMAWTRHFGLIRGPEAVERIEQARFGLYAAAIQPEASLDDLRVYAAFLAWLFIVNDQHGEALYGSPSQWNIAVKPLIDVSAQPRRIAPEEAPAVHALADVLVTVYPRMSGSWRQRFATHFADVLRSAATESHDRLKDHIPAEAVYVANRRIVSAGAPMLDLAEFCAPAELPASLRDSPSYRSMRDAATDAMAWTNDIVSADKERAAGEVHNYVLVVAHHRSLSEHQAQNLVVDRVHARVSDFQTAEVEFLKQVSCGNATDSVERTARFLARSMRHFMIGHAYWARLSHRYRSETVPALALEDVLRPSTAPIRLRPEGVSYS